jgi:hypothetical protein
VADDIHGAANGVDDSGDIFPLAFKRIRVGIATAASPPPVQGIHAAVPLQCRLHRCPHEMVVRGAMHE